MSSTGNVTPTMVKFNKDWWKSKLRVSKARMDKSGYKGSPA